MSINIVTTDQFAELRQNFGYYVDKTRFVVDFLQDPTDASRFRVPASATLFTRPRRFGKTLFMSMLAEFFDITKNSQELFAGLKVAENDKLCREWMNQYPVVFLTLKDVSKPSFGRTLALLQETICNFCEQHTYLLSSERIERSVRKKIQKYLDLEADEDQLALSLYTLTKALSRHYNKRVIVLIDEYDVPVAKAAERGYDAGERGYYNDMIQFMRGFFSPALKSNPHLNFAILTGALRITKESIFTGLNNLDCYDISASEYADIFGFTQDEVDKMLADAGCEEKRDIIRDWYDGYHFGKRQDIYCPWSITKYLRVQQRHPEDAPQAWWVSTSANELPRDFVERLPKEADVQGKFASLQAGNPIAVKLNPYMNYIDILTSADNFWTLLYLTGYLTLARETELPQVDKNAEDCLLVIPNREVRKVFQTELEPWLKNILPDSPRAALYKALWEQDIQKFEEQLTAMLVNSSFHDAKEAYYHGMMFGILAIRYGDTISNGESGRGLYDIVVQDKGNSCAAVLEFKLASSAEQLEACVHNALRQIAEQDYDARLKASGWKTILHAGIAFCQKSVKVGFEEVRVETGCHVPEQGMRNES